MTLEQQIDHFGETAMRIKAERDELLASLKDVYRIALAMSLSTGAGKGQKTRLDAAKALIARMEVKK